MNPDNKTKIFIMAGVLVVALAAFGVVFFVMNQKPAPPAPPPMATRPVMPPMGAKPGAPGMKPGMPMATTPGMPAKPGMPMATKPGMPMPPAAKPTMPVKPVQVAKVPVRPMGKPLNMPPVPPAKPQAPTGPTLPAPAAPPTPGSPVFVAGLPDPFQGGPPPKPKPKPPPPPPPEVKISAIPSFFATPNGIRHHTYSGGSTISARNAEPPLGRHAGWIYNSNGKVMAIFEDNDGNAKAVGVGDPVDDMTVKVITPTYIILADADGKEHKIPLQGLDSYLGKSRAKDVEVTPKMPAWGGQ